MHGGDAGSGAPKENKKCAQARFIYEGSDRIAEATAWVIAAATKASAEYPMTPTSSVPRLEELDPFCILPFWSMRPCFARICSAALLTLSFLLT
jgi:hypothetical protein